MDSPGYPQVIHRLSTGLSTPLRSVCPTSIHSRSIHSFHRPTSPQVLTCCVVGNSLWIPRGIPVDSSRNPQVVHRLMHSVHNPAKTVDQLEDNSRMDVEQLLVLHSCPQFILESSPGHPHAATPYELQVWAKSTVSTAPTTTSVLLLIDLCKKQALWRSSRRSSRPGPRPIRARSGHGTWSGGPAERCGRT